MKNPKYIIVILLVVIAGIFQASCSDDLNEIKDIKYERVFSPTNMQVLVLNGVNARLTWTKNSTAESYVIELFENDSLSFDGTPSVTIADVTNEQIPYTVQNLENEMRYSARIKAINKTMSDSKWSAVTFKTAAEYLLLPFEDGDIQATTATFRWPVGEMVTEIVLEPGNIKHAVTPDEVNAGVATVAGLTGSTTYAVSVLNGTKVRASTQISTLVDIGNATPVYPENDFIAMLAEAKAGEVFALFPGTYKNKGESDKIVINKNVEIKGVYPYDKPILKGYVSVEDGASLLLKDIILDGEGTSSHSIVFSTEAMVHNHLIIDACEIRNYEKGLMYLNVVSEVKEITFNNNLIYNVQSGGSDFIDSRKGAFHTLNFTNNTVYNSVKGRDFIRYDDASKAFPNVSSTILVDHNTLHSVSNSSGKRLLYVRFKANKIRFTNNIVAETVGIFTNQDNTDPATAFEGNNYFNAPNLFSESAAGAKFFDDLASKEDPGFKDAANGNFTLSNEVLKAKGIGDPRWAK